MTTYAQVAERLGDSGLQLLARLNELFQGRKPGSQGQFLWLHAGGLGSDETILHFGRERVPHDPVDFQELIDTGMVRRGNERNTYRLTHSGRELHRIVTEARGPTPVAQLDTAARTLLEDPERLTRTHPEVARHLQAAFDLLWSETMDDRTIINIGNELRSALTRLTKDLVGDDGAASPEKMADALGPWLREEGRLPPRSPEMLVELIRWSTKANQRLHHLHDESYKDQPRPEWSEVRRTTFTAAFVVNEVVAVELDGRSA